ncbi:unnamed protein product [Schistosoma spindalis]|nr:unnamed protein product [Schistosoma spindale]
MKTYVFIPICWISIIALVFPTDEAKFEKKPDCDSQKQDKNCVKKKKATASELSKDSTKFEEEKPKCNGHKQDKNCVKKKKATASELSKDSTKFEEEKPKCNGHKQDKNCVKKKKATASELSKDSTKFEEEKPKCNGHKQDKNCVKKKKATASELSKDSTKFEEEKPECDIQPIITCVNKLTSAAPKSSRKNNLGKITKEDINESLKRKKYQQQLFLCHVTEQLKKRWRHCLRGDEKKLKARKKYLESINYKPEIFDIITYVNLG